MDNNPAWAFPFATREDTPVVGNATSLNTTDTTVTSTASAFAGWPSRGYILINKASTDTGEYMYYSTRTDTALTIGTPDSKSGASVAGRGLFSTAAQSHASSSTFIYQANQFMQMKNYCSGTIGQVPVAGSFPNASDEAIRSSSYKTLMRNFTVTLSNYAPEEGEPLDDFLDRGLDSFW